MKWEVVISSRLLRIHKGKPRSTYIYYVALTHIPYLLSCVIYVLCYSIFFICENSLVYNLNSAKHKKLVWKRFVNIRRKRIIEQLNSYYELIFFLFDQITNNRANLSRKIWEIKNHHCQRVFKHTRHKSKVNKFLIYFNCLCLRALSIHISLISKSQFLTLKGIVIIFDRLIPISMEYKISLN